MSKDKFYYLASPYASKDPKVMNYRKIKACNTIVSLLDKGVYAISPIAHNTNLVTESYYTLPTGWDFWKPYDFAMIKACDALLVLTIDGWEDSFGVTAEIEYAKELEMDVQYINEDGFIL